MSSSSRSKSGQNIDLDIKYLCLNPCSFEGCYVLNKTNKRLTFKLENLEMLASGAFSGKILLESIIFVYVNAIYIYLYNIYALPLSGWVQVPTPGRRMRL